MQLLVLYNSKVHGKDTFLHGVFGNNVISLKVMDFNGEILNLDKKNDRLFYAIGTFGLTYLILEAKLKITKIKSPLLNVSTIKFSNYFEMLNLFKKFKDQNSQMMGVWIDHFDKRGKGIFKAAKWSNKNNAEFKKINFTKGILKNIYISFFYPVIKILLVNRPAMKIFNFLLYNLTTQKEQLSHFVDFYFPQQKFLSEESRLYSGGKINIQLLVPEKDAEKILINISELCNKFKMESWWLGIKKHIKDKFILVYALDGYDITLQWSQKIFKKKRF